MLLVYNIRNAFENNANFIYLFILYVYMIVLLIRPCFIRQWLRVTSNIMLMYKQYYGRIYVVYIHRLLIFGRCFWCFEVLNKLINYWNEINIEHCVTYYYIVIPILFSMLNYYSYYFITSNFHHLPSIFSSSYLLKF